ncbi:MAG: hypothetical protein QJR06_11000 [Alicyclobacillaceae bacterium]|nr:hypothetical protein [Alicyclobacillaceae bacterium]
MGFVTEITEPDQLQDRAIALAGQIAAYPQGSLRTDKQTAL